MSDTMEEGVIAAWHKKVGDKVKPGDLLAEVETDKATMELESYQEGTLLYIGVEKGASVKVNGILAILGKEGEDYKSLLDEAPTAKATTEEKPKEVKETETAKAETPAPKAAVATETVTAKAEPAATSNEDGRLKASPLAKKIASEKGIDISQLKGSGDEGRIVKKDVEAFSASPQPAASKSTAAAPVVLPSVSGEESYDEMAVSQMRKTIAKRLAESKFSAPHFYLTMRINMDKVVTARASLNEVSPVKISFNDIVVKAAAAALKQHPKVNSSWLGDKIRTNHHIHIGVAVAVEEGLLVPVIRFANEKTLSHKKQNERFPKRLLKDSPKRLSQTKDSPKRLFEKTI
jgi:pyruvate dehydrogenase E2 component (dihydrolipoamide acetyltransferase)